MAASITWKTMTPAKPRGGADPPVHAVGECADRSPRCTPVIDVAARDDNLTDRVARVHGGDQLTKTGRLELSWQPRQMSRHMDRFEWRRLLRRAHSRSWRGVAAGSVGIRAARVCRLRVTGRSSWSLRRWWVAVRASRGLGE